MDNKIFGSSIYRRHLSCGTLSITHDCSNVAYLDELFDIAERHNPKRAFLFVSKVLGRHIPISPRKMRETYQKIAKQFPAYLEGPTVFIGMAETAVGLGAGVFDEVSTRYPQSVYLTSTRHPIDNATLLCEFKENHSHATDHLLYFPNEKNQQDWVKQARTVVLIDDEATTGNTFLNLLSALQIQGKLINIQQVITVTLTDWSDSAIAKRCSLPFKSISLVQGKWQWQATPNAPLPTPLNINVSTKGHVAITGKQNWGRLGMRYSTNDLAPLIHTNKGEKILVLGTGEFVWVPFLLAERLEKQGAIVKFSATTRSPISMSFAIKSAITFADNYGLGIPNFLYNVTHQQFDRILLCCETPITSIDNQLIYALKKIAPCVEILSYE